MDLYLVTVFYFLLGGAIGLMIARAIMYVIRWLVRASDKSRIKAAMAREAYLNDLYDECLYEHQDRLARKAAEKMSFYDR